MGFTPFIGLAVVVALALAAVFGSMSLANPAMAAIGQPADAELTERTNDAQVAQLMLTLTGGPTSVVGTFSTTVTEDTGWSYKRAETEAAVDVIAAWTALNSGNGTDDDTISIADGLATFTVDAPTNGQT